MFSTRAALALLSVFCVSSVSADSGTIRFDSEYSYEILDPTTRINRKQLLILDRKKNGTLAPDRLYVHGAVTAIANYQSTNKDDKFGYLMRHPTAANQVGETVSEATIHSAQLGLTGMLGHWITAHAVLLYDPEQSFGKGTNMAIDRNQVQVRRAFGGLANGVTAGYANEGLNLAFMGIQGGSQFRAVNTPVEGTAVPSGLNNFAADANYVYRLGAASTLLLGGSYHNNPAFDIYAKLVYGALTIKGELARTTDEWPGTFNPDLPEFAASKVTSFDVGARYRYDSRFGPTNLSAEFSRFIAGEDGAPWERQNQLVLGLAWFVRPSVKFFRRIYPRCRLCTAELHQRKQHQG